jgi:hypothetical protein
MKEPYLFDGFAKLELRRYAPFPSWSLGTRVNVETACP